MNIYYLNKESKEDSFAMKINYWIIWIFLEYEGIAFSYVYLLKQKWRERLSYHKFFMCEYNEMEKVIVFSYLPHPNHLVFNGKVQYFQDNFFLNAVIIHTSRFIEVCIYIQVDIWGGMVYDLKSILISGDHPLLCLYNFFPCTEETKRRKKKKTCSIGRDEINP